MELGRLMNRSYIQTCIWS